MSVSDLIGENIEFIAKNPLYEGTTTFLEEGQIETIVNSRESFIVFDGYKYKNTTFRLYCLHIEEPTDEFLDGMRKLLQQVKGKSNNSTNKFVRKWFDTNGYDPIKQMNGILVRGVVKR